MSVTQKKYTNFHGFIKADDDDKHKNGERSTIGGILSDRRTCWFAQGGDFRVQDLQTGRKISSWSFGWVVRDTTVRVICVEELPGMRRRGNIPLLAIGLECPLSGGMLCIYDAVTSRVVRAVEFGAPVTCLALVGAPGGCLPGPLSATFEGVLAVGTVGGDVYLLDLCKQSISEALNIYGSSVFRNEINPCQLSVMIRGDLTKLDRYKERAENMGQHLAFYMNHYVVDNPEHFPLRGPNEESLIFVAKAEVVVSAVTYVQQLCAVIVGYNFGSFQIWSVLDMTVIFTSNLHRDRVPITHFVIQEPSDDPRTCCYLWAVYSHDDPRQPGFPLAVMHSLSYASKEWHDGYGYIYEDLNSCAIRFQLELADVTADSQTAVGAQCLAAHGYPPTSPISDASNMGGRGSGDALVMCAFAWLTYYPQTNTHRTHLAIFDLNQWYLSQMPGGPRESHCDTYLSRICISDHMTTPGHPVLDVRVDEATVRQFLGAQRLEEHFHPNSISYDCIAITPTTATTIHHRGIQAHILQQLSTLGPLALLKPGLLYAQCLRHGLTPIHCRDEGAVSPSAPVQKQRELLLGVALERAGGLQGLLRRCANAWADGSSLAVGCALDWLLQWAWTRAAAIKTQVNALCVPLFDCSGSALDTSLRPQLDTCLRQLGELRRLFEHAVRLHDEDDTSGGRSEKSPAALLAGQQADQLRAFAQRLDVLRWMLGVGLLPELCYGYATEEGGLGSDLPSLLASIATDTEHRRAALASCPSIDTSTPSLYIDALVQHECGAGALVALWRRCDSALGVTGYPPRSLQAALLTYVVEGVKHAHHHQHALMAYLLLDLAYTLNHQAAGDGGVGSGGRYAELIERALRFPQVVGMCASDASLVQAFFQLDHGDFGAAMEQLVDKGVGVHVGLTEWQHRLVLRTLLAHGQHHFALMYEQIRKPAFPKCPSDALLTLSLYVRNKRLHDALAFHRRNRDRNNPTRLLTHLFTECQATGQLNALINYCLAPDEEDALFAFMDGSAHADTEVFRVIYLAQRSRHAELACLRHRAPPSTGGLLGQAHAPIGAVLAASLARHLPPIARELVRNHAVIGAGGQGRADLLTRSTPMSVVMNDTSQTRPTQSTVINAAVSKAHETWRLNSLSGQPTRVPHKRPRTEDIPFLCTPKFAAPPGHMDVSTVIFPKTLDQSHAHEEPAEKRLRLTTPRRSLDRSAEKRTPKKDVNISYQLDTPVVNPCDPKLSNSVVQLFTVTPQGILKKQQSPDHSHRGESTTPENIDDIITYGDTCNISQRVTPRKSIRSAVRFIDLTSSTETSSLQTRENSLAINSSKETSKSTTLSTEDTYYSPNTSLEHATNKEENDHSEDDNTLLVETYLKTGPSSRLSPPKDLSVSPERVQQPIQTTGKSPLRRKAIRDISLEPVRSSPRLRRSLDRELGATESKSPSTSPNTKLSSRKTISKSTLDQKIQSKSAEAEDSKAIGAIEGKSPSTLLSSHTSIGKSSLDQDNRSKIIEIQHSETIGITKSKSPSTSPNTKLSSRRSLSKLMLDEQLSKTAGIRDSRSILEQIQIKERQLIERTSTILKGEGISEFSFQERKTETNVSVETKEDGNRESNFAFHEYKDSIEKRFVEILTSDDVETSKLDKIDEASIKESYPKPPILPTIQKDTTAIQEQIAQESTEQAIILLESKVVEETVVEEIATPITDWISERLEVVEQYSDDLNIANASVQEIDTHLIMETVLLQDEQSNGADADDTISIDVYDDLDQDDIMQQVDEDMDVDENIEENDDVDENIEADDDHENIDEVVDIEEQNISETDKQSSQTTNSSVIEVSSNSSNEETDYSSSVSSDEVSPDSNSLEEKDSNKDVLNDDVLQDEDTANTEVSSRSECSSAKSGVIGHLDMNISGNTSYSSVVTSEKAELQQEQEDNVDNSLEVDSFTLNVSEEVLDRIVAAEPVVESPKVQDSETEAEPPEVDNSVIVVKENSTTNVDEELHSSNDDSQVIQVASVTMNEATAGSNDGEKKVVSSELALDNPDIDSSNPVSQLTSESLQDTAVDTAIDDSEDLLQISLSDTTIEVTGRDELALSWNETAKNLSNFNPAVDDTLSYNGSDSNDPDILLQQTLSDTNEQDILLQQTPAGQRRPDRSYHPDILTVTLSDRDESDSTSGVASSQGTPSTNEGRGQDTPSTNEGRGAGRGRTNSRASLLECVTPTSARRSARLRKASEEGEGGSTLVAEVTNDNAPATAPTPKRRMRSASMNDAPTVAAKKAAPPVAARRIARRTRSVDVQVTPPPNRTVLLPTIAEEDKSTEDTSSKASTSREDSTPTDDYLGSRRLSRRQKALLLQLHPSSIPAATSVAEVTREETEQQPPPMESEKKKVGRPRGPGTKRRTPSYSASEPGGVSRPVTRNRSRSISSNQSADARSSLSSLQLTIEEVETKKPKRGRRATSSSNT